jgi:hypothetical protein
LPYCFDGTLAENNRASVRDGIARLWEQEIALLLPTLSEKKKRMRVEKSNQLLQTLISIKHHSC